MAYGDANQLTDRGGKLLVQQFYDPPTNKYVAGSAPGGASDSTAVALASVSTPAAASNLVLRAAPCNFYGAQVCTAAVAGYLMLFDAIAAPPDGTVTPKKVWAVAANTAIELDYVPPIRMSTGAVLVFSSTGQFTKTASATAFMSGEVA